jgi:glycogen(starch) synthase
LSFGFICQVRESRVRFVEADFGSNGREIADGVARMAQSPEVLILDAPKREYMKILLTTHGFAPIIGGTETSSLDLARAFIKMGHEVQVITQTPSRQPDDDHGLTVLRRPDRAALFRALRWCNVFFQNNISLQTAWPLVFIRKPWVVCTQTWLKNHDGPTNLGSRLKMLLLRFATNVYIAQAVRNHVGYPGVVLPNPYNAETFRVIPGIARRQSLVFLGRLASDKGCDLLIQSLAKLRETGLVLPLTIIGVGPEHATLKKQVADSRLEELVQFAGALRGESLARELNRHQVLVVPSRWAEPFGIVAVEAIACGCLVVGSAGGGLPDAIGGCGITFKNGDADDLARAIREMVTNPDLAARCRQAVPAHLHNHRSETVARCYEEIFKNVLS